MSKESAPPYPIGPGQRALAAIMFTDVVSFSSRVHREEVTTLHLLERDLEAMQRLCEKHSGSVLKTTGDGLLLYFSSAVQAVGCALKIQQRFAERARTEPAAEVLTHRIGIHLGDVFVNDQDVMGDGVNIASRLQAEAEPGGICISQTVFDVVKNKLQLNAVRLPARGLKNIPELLAIYRIRPPGAEPAAGPAATALPLSPPAVPAPTPLFTRRQKLTVAGVLVAGLVAATWLILEAQRRHEAELARSRAAQAELDALVATQGQAALASDPGAAAAKPAPPPEPAPEAAPSGNDSATRIQELFAWLDAALRRYTRDSPLLLREPVGGLSRETKVFTDAEGRLYFAEGGAIRPRVLDDLKAEAVGAVIVSTLLDVRTPPPAEVLEGAAAFARIRNLPEMTTALRDNGFLPH